MTEIIHPLHSPLGLAQRMGFSVSGRLPGKTLSIKLGMGKGSLTLPVGFLLDDEKNTSVDFYVNVSILQPNKVLQLAALPPRFNPALPLLRRMGFKVDVGWSLKSEAAAFELNRMIRIVNKYKTRVQLPKNDLKLPEYLQNRKILPFQMSDLTPEVASLALRRKLHVYHPIVLAIADGTITEDDIPSYQGLPLPLLGELLATTGASSYH